MITSFNKTALRLTTKTCEGIWIETCHKVDRTHKKRRWRVNAVATPVPGINPVRIFFWRFVKDTVFVPTLPANLQIFATVSPLLWLWSTVVCWHACGTRWTIAWISAVLPTVDTLSICEICKNKNLESFSLYRRKNYHDPLSSLFVANFLKCFADLWIAMYYQAFQEFKRCDANEAVCVLR